MTEQSARTMTGFQGAIFDVDGVLVDSPHEHAWRESLRELMEGEWSDLRAQSRWAPDAFTTLVYQTALSGKPRLDGARDALVYFGVPDAGARAAAYAQRKQAMLERLIDAGKFTAYPDALRLIIALKDLGLHVAAASSSKNAPAFLRRIRLDEFVEAEALSSPSVHPGLTLHDYFDVDVSGRNFAHGKPHPEMFLTAASELGVVPQAAVVIEDAVAGIQAAKAGDMAAIGVARLDDVALLREAGADVVVESLDELDPRDLARGRFTRLAG